MFFYPDKRFLISLNSSLFFFLSPIERCLKSTIQYYDWSSNFVLKIVNEKDINFNVKTLERIRRLNSIALFWYFYMFTVSFFRFLANFPVILPSTIKA